MTTNRDTTKYPFTADEIGALRDGEMLSWRNVAERLALGSPGAARRAYTQLVRPHTESVLPGRAPGDKLQPVHLADADLDTVRDTIAGKTIVVQRAKGTEDMPVAKVFPDGTQWNAGTPDLSYAYDNIAIQPKWPNASSAVVPVNVIRKT